MSADRPPAEKLPLATRKNVRDGWDSKKPLIESKLADLLGVSWTFDINPLVIWPYAEEGSYGQNALGDCIYAYVDGLMSHLPRFLETYGEDGKAELNTIASTHTITLLPSSSVTYCGIDFSSGILRILFHPARLGSNINDAAQGLAGAISKAPQPAGAPSLSFTARHSIAADWTLKVGDVLEKCRALLQNSNFTFEPDFEALGEKLKAGKGAREDWESNLGEFARLYFEGFRDVLEREKFGVDDLLREGLEEGVPAGVLRLRVVDKLTPSGYYNEIVLEEGVLVMQTTPENWGSNISYAADKLVDIL